MNVSEGTDLSMLGTAPFQFHSWKLFLMCF